MSDLQIDIDKLLAKIERIKKAANKQLEFWKAHLIRNTTKVQEILEKEVSKNAELKEEVKENEIELDELDDKDAVF